MNPLYTFLESSGRSWLDAIVQLSVEIALLSLLIFVGTWIFRIRSPSARHLLWLLLLAKPLVWTLTDTEWSVFQFDVHRLDSTGTVFKVVIVTG